MAGYNRVPPLNRELCSQLWQPQVQFIVSYRVGDDPLGMKSYILLPTRVGAMETVYADKLYAFLTEMAAAAHASGNQEAVLRIDFAMKHYTFPLTSEFLGESMLALRELLNTSQLLFTSEQASQAKE